MHTFLGVPYAAPPFGANRLRPPRPVEPWSGVRDAIAFGAEPPQLKPPPDHPAAAMVWDPAEPGEDCLNLNIWTPDPAAHGLPVMVWIPGGMFEVGTGATYDGSRFARDGVVCVTINYRVGPEGFLYLADGDANLGLLDQVAALEWVRENIAAFGGDPGNVTIFGESAGAMSVGTLLAVPRAEGLFRRAICQSGAADRVIPADTALRIGRELAERLGIEATRDAFATVPPDRLLVAAAELKGDLVAHPDPARWGLEVIASMLPWQPVIDGDVLPGPPDRPDRGRRGRRRRRHGRLEHRRLEAVRDRQRLPRAGHRRDADRARSPTHGFETALAYGLSDETRGRVPRGLSRAPAPASCSRRSRPTGGAGSPRIRLAEAHASAPSGTYMYEFAWPAPGARGLPRARDRRSCSTPWTWAPARCSGRCSAGAPQALADAMHGAWVAFATTGDPGWPRYDPDRRATMRFDTVSRVVDDPRAFERGLWETAGRFATPVAAGAR